MNRWINADREKPIPGVEVLVVVAENPYERRKILIGEWIPGMTIEYIGGDEFDDDDLGYDPDTDTHYYPEGWAMRVNECGDTEYLSRIVTHWKPIDEMPEVFV